MIKKFNAFSPAKFSITSFNLDDKCKRKPVEKGPKIKNINSCDLYFDSKYLILLTIVFRNNKFGKSL